MAQELGVKPHAVKSPSCTSAARWQFGTTPFHKPAMPPWRAIVAKALPMPLQRPQYEAVPPHKALPRAEQRGLSSLHTPVTWLMAGEHAFTIGLHLHFNEICGAGYSLAKDPCAAQQSRAHSRVAA